MSKNTPFMYETMYILRADISDEMIDQAIARYQNILRDHGATLLETQHRGRRRLAYDIYKAGARFREGVYVQMNYTGGGKLSATLERAMRLGDDVIRYLTVKQELEAAVSATV